MGAHGKYFSEAELRCKHCKANGMDQDFVDLLDLLRSTYNKPIKLNSAYRCPEYDKSIGGGGAHTTGRAVDIRIEGAEAVKLLGLAITMGFKGIGVQQKGEHEKRFLHLDTAPTPAFPRPMIWSYA